MSVTAQQGIIGFNTQSAKGTAATAFFRHKAVGIDMSPLDDVRLGTPEIGGNSTPTFPYKGGYMAGGGFSVFPRLESSIGNLLYAVLGAFTTTADSPEVGANRHSFTHATDDSFLPWVSLRKYIPGATSSDDIGELYTDAKCVNAVLNLVNDGPISMRMDFLAREFTEVDNATAAAWTWENTYETYESIPVGSVVGGYFMVPDFSASELPIVGASIQFVNGPLDVRQEKIYGDPKLEDITIVGRSVIYDILLKWKDAQLWRTLLTGSGTGTAWTASPYAADVEIVAQSPGNMGALSSPYQLKVTSEEVLWQPVGGIQLAAGQSVMLRMRGVALDNTTNFVQVDVDNEASTFQSA